MNSNVIPGFKKLTPQQVFNMSVKHVLKNGRPSVALDGTCVYGGIGCGAAPFLTKKVKESEKFERKSWYQLARASTACPAVVPKENCNIICELQQAHDEASDYSINFLIAYKENVRKIASHYGFSLPKELQQ